jgi:hypothetical protein
MQSKDEFSEWRTMKFDNQKMSKFLGSAQEDASRIGHNIPLPINKDKQMQFFWTDAHEENFGADVYLFGLVMDPKTKKLNSCCVTVKGM